MALKQNRLMGAVLDVWEGEPEINEELLKKVDLGTSHIAGYSFDGKTNATLLIYRAVCGFLNAPCDWQLPELPSPPRPKIEVDENKKSDEEILAEVVGKAYDLKEDDKTLRQVLEIPQSQRGNFFDQLRSKYPVRREFKSIEVNIKGANQGLSQKLKTLGFRLVEA
jgi:erythronate-4-phosphate dehydrogenase